jgi:uncharacterized repeat protein (TIGR03803 family)
MSKLSLWRTICLVCVFCWAAVIASPAQTFMTLVSFNGNDGSSPRGTLVQGLNGNYYGTTLQGGARGFGTIFDISAEGKLTRLYSFCSQADCSDGAFPEAGLVQATNGNLYGTTEQGGAHEFYGTVFQVSAEGKLTKLYSFCSKPNCTDGYDPYAGLVQATNGDFYGTTELGGANDQGTVFKITPGGTLTTLYSFCSQADCSDGAKPLAGLVQATNGNFYGTTEEGGAKGVGIVFEMTGAGKLTRLYSFCSQADCSDGSYPEAGLVQAINGNFYGTTYSGGAYSGGTVFEISAGGTLTTLLSFDDTDGANPLAGLVQATNGNFYGTTSNEGASGVYGTVFGITGAGKLTALHSFEGTDGASPYAGLVQATNGNLYGTASSGGTDDDGTVFSLAVGLGPFVETLPTSGVVGAAVTILGNNLTGATSVTFNSKAATFRVVSGTEITTTVPSGATTGPVKVKTPSGTLMSNVNFRVS